MPFTIKLYEVVSFSSDGSIGVNPRIRAVLRAQKLPFQMSWDLSKVGKKLEGELKDYSDHRAELVKELDSADEKWREDPDQIKTFTARHAELLDVDVTVEVNPFKVAQFERAEGITGDDLIACHAFIVE